MEKRPFSASVALWPIILVALLWLGFGVVVAANAHPALPDQPVVRIILSGGAFVTAVALLLLWALLQKRNRLGYLLSLALFSVIILVTFFDDVGLADLIFLSLCVIVLILLLKDRKWYLDKKTS